MKKLLLCLLIASGSLWADDLAPLKVVGGVLTDANEMTAYVFDRDSEGVSNCNGACARTWPPIAAPEGDVSAPLSVVVRQDHTRQLAYKKRPVYRYAGDSQAGETNGDGLGGIWHLVRP